MPVLPSVAAPRGGAWTPPCRGEPLWASAAVHLRCCPTAPTRVLPLEVGGQECGVAHLVEGGEVGVVGHRGVLRVQTTTAAQEVRMSYNPSRATAAQLQVGPCAAAAALESEYCRTALTSTTCQLGVV